MAVGQWVEAGQVIVRLDDRIAKDNLETNLEAVRPLRAQRRASFYAKLELRVKEVCPV